MADGGGIILDMFCHWRYVIDNLFGDVTGVFALGANHMPERIDEQGRPYEADSDDAAYALFQTGRGVTCQFNSSWCTRVRKDDLFVMHVDGTAGSAVAGLRECRIQPHASTPKPVWNPDIAPVVDYWAHWDTMPTNQPMQNAFRAQWELFLRHVALDEPFRWDLREGAKGVQLAELGYASWKQRAWLDVPELA
jgi:predicted dehydrogenase